MHWRRMREFGLPESIHKITDHDKLNFNSRINRNEETILQYGCHGDSGCRVFSGSRFCPNYGRAGNTTLSNRSWPGNLRPWRGNRSMCLHQVWISARHKPFTVCGQGQNQSASVLFVQSPRNHCSTYLSVEPAADECVPLALQQQLLAIWPAHRFGSSAEFGVSIDLQLGCWSDKKRANLSPVWSGLSGDHGRARHWWFSSGALLASKYDADRCLPRSSSVLSWFSDYLIFNRRSS